MKYTFYTILFFFLCSFSIQSQESNKIYFKSGVVETTNNLQSIDWDNDLQEYLWEEDYFVLIQFETKPNVKTQNKLEALGIEVFNYMPDNAYLVKIPKTIWTNNWHKDFDIQYVSGIQKENKLYSTLYNIEGELEINVQLYPNVDETRFEDAISELGLTKVKDLFGISNFAFKADEGKIEAIAKIPCVKYISPIVKPELLVDENIRNARADYVKSTTTLGLSGDGVYVGIGDGGTVLNHYDLNDRLTVSPNAPVSNHGSVVTGIVGGSGLISPEHEGFAPQVDLYAEFFNLIINNTPALYTSNNMTITNNSYRDGYTDFCAEAGLYTVISEFTDNQLNTQDEVNHVFAAGNDGGITCAPLPTGYGTVAHQWQSSKNAIVVGSITYDNNIAGNSSRGPLKDGRIKPEVVAVGVSVTSTSTDNNYSGGSGTSYASPSTAGTLALLTEHYKDLNGGSNPKADLLKATLCNSADDLGNAGPDYIYGFGRVNARRAADVLTNTTYFTGSLSGGGNAMHNITVPAGADELKIMLYWHDVSASPLSNPALVNNLDLTVDDPVATTYNPWVLDPVNPANIATRNIDNINNIEQFTITNPTAGTWVANIDATTIPIGTQNYVLVYEVRSDELVLTAPLGGEMYNAGETVSITWDAIGYGATGYTLEYSLNSGSTWTLIDNAVSGTATQYDWTTPTVISNQVRIRITDNSTATTSMSAADFTIMAVPTGLSVSPNCGGEMSISWNAVTGATSYDVLRLNTGTNTMDFLINVAGTSHTDTGLSTGEEYFYSIQAVSGAVKSRYPQARGAIASGVLVNTFPYSEDFESTNGNFYTGGKNSSWAWGSPSGTLIDRAAEGSNAWVTNLSGNYNTGENSYLYTPCFDLTSMTTPIFSFAFALDIEDNEVDPNSLYDYAQVFYSTNGTTWTRLGVQGDGHNWYNNAGTQNVWDGTKSHWHSVSIPVPAAARTSSTRFRFFLNSDPFEVQEGIAIDDIHIYESTAIYSGANTNVTQAVSGSNWVHFDSGGNRIVSINPNGQDLGSTAVDVYINGAAVRYTDDQYYLDRNWRINPTNAPASNVSLRLYMLDTEVETLRAATGCGVCTTIEDAFIAGVTKYTNNDGSEDGTLANNNGGISNYTFFIPNAVDFVPYQDGYYVEFQVADFSEFYINGGGLGMSEPLPVELLTFDAIKNGEDAVLTWQTASELNFSHFEIEVAKGDEALLNNDFINIGKVFGKGGETNGADYRFVDVEENKNGIRYYRLKMIDVDETFEYSFVRNVLFNKEISLSIYPNPIKNNNINIQIENVDSQTIDLEIWNELGQKIHTQNINLDNGVNTINIDAHQIQLASGSYWIKLISGSSIITEPFVYVK